MIPAGTGQTQKTPTRHRVPIDRTTPPRPPRLGKVRLGIQAKSKTGTYYPKATNYFRVEQDESGITSQAAVDAFTLVYGDQPKTLHIMLLHDKTEHVLESAYRLYGTSKLKRVCNGTSSSVRLDAGGWEEGPCRCDAEGLAEDDAGRCQLTHTFWFSMPDLPLGPGLWELDTGSEISERELREYLLFIEQARGTLLFYEFDLALTPTKVAPDGKVKTVYTLSPVAQASDRTMRDVINETKTRATQAAIAAPIIEPPPTPSIDKKRDVLISPTQEAKDAAIAELVADQPLPTAINESFHHLGEDQAEFIQLAKADMGGAAVTVDALAAQYGDQARDLPGLLTHLRATLPETPSGPPEDAPPAHGAGEDEGGEDTQ